MFEHSRSDEINHHKHDDHDNHDEHDKHAHHSVAMFRSKFWLSLVLTVPVLIYSEMIQAWLSFSPPAFTGSEYIPALLASVIFFYGGLVFIKGAISEIKSRSPGMMSLIALAIITAYSYSLATLFIIDGESFFWELATLITIMLLGHWLEMAAISKAEGALEAISKLLPDMAEKLIPGQQHPEKVAVSQLVKGDLVLVRPGSSVPVDGVVKEGDSSVDEAIITGESKPVAKSVGDNVIAGSINQDGSLTIEVKEVGESTALAGIMRLVLEAQKSKSKSQVLADKAALLLTIVAVVSGLVTLGVWWLLGDINFAVARAVTVIIIACPHALGLAIPLVVSISTTLSAQNGLLIRKRPSLEAARNIDVVLFDKTGTLTRGEHGVSDIWTVDGLGEEEVLKIAASLEQNSEHIIGRGIVAAAKDRDIKLDKVDEFKALAGAGVEGAISGENFRAVSRRYIEENGLVAPKEISSQALTAAKEGKTEVYLLNQDDKVLGLIALADMVREESKQTIEDLRTLGIKTAMITGDSKEVAAYVSKSLGIDQYFAEVKPEDKVAKVKSLQVDGSKVAMVGDGVNDAPALMQADIGIAIGAGTDVAIKSADIILVKNNPLDVIKVINLSKAAYRKMVQNLIWASGYNVLAIPLAAGAAISFGIVLSPAVGAVLMSLSTIIVALNAQLLRGQKL